MTTTNEDTVLSQYVQGFRANLNLAPMQKDSRLIGTVDSDLGYDTPGQMFNADDIGRSDPVDVTSRVPDTPDKFLAMTRRVGMFAGFADSFWVDNADKARELVDPTSKSMMSMMAGRWRKADKNILGTIGGIGGLIGNAYYKADSSGTLSTQALPAAQLIAATDQSYIHDAETAPTAGHQFGLNVGKIIHAGLILDESELEGERYWVGATAQKADLLRSTPATSRYYSEVQALVAGKVDSFMGFNFVWLASRYVPVSATAGNNTSYANRANVAYIKDALVYRGRPILSARMTERSDKSYRVQAYYETEHGSVRRYDTAVVEVDCYEGPAY